MSMKFRLETSGAVREFEFDRDRVTIGRGPLNDVVVKHDDVSPRHGALRVEDDGQLRWACRLGAACAFLHGGEEVDATDGSEERSWVLEAGDVVKIGGERATTLEILEAVTLRRAPPVFLPFDDTPLSDAGKSVLRELAQALADDTSSPGTILSAFRSLLDLAGLRGGSSTFVVLSGTDDYHNDAWSIDDKGRCAQGADPTRFLGPSANEISARWADGECLAAVEDVALIPVGGADAVIVYRREKLSPGELRDLAQLGHWIQPYADLFLARHRRKRMLGDVIEENRYFRERQRQHYLFKELVAESDSMQSVHEKIRSLAAADAPVLIAGEAGTGKELLARFLHHSSDRSDQVVLQVKGSEFSNERANLELFGLTDPEVKSGHRQGVFELARGGSVFLEEIDLLPPPVQAKLCRALKEGEIRRVGDSVGRPIRARLIASVHRNLHESVADGRLRRDLFLLLRDQLIEVPPLRDRSDDILPLARNFVGVYASRYARNIDGFTPDGEERLLEHDWPGNVRELQARIESGVLGTKGPRIGVRDLGL